MHQDWNRRHRCQYKWPFLGPEPKMTLEIVHSSVEGFSADKDDILSGMETDIICLQERQRETIAPDIPGMHIGMNVERISYACM